MSGTSDIGPFSIIPRWVREACKGWPHALALYAALADHADRANDNAWTIGRQALADETGASLRTIDASVKQLEAVGALEVTRQKRGEENIWSRYKIFFAGKGGAESARGGADIAPGGAKNSTLLLEPPTRPITRDQSFDEFWKGYPRKIGKPAATRAWSRVPLKEHLPVMLGLSLWVAYWKRAKTETSFIPYAQKWLNEKRWQDPPESKPLAVEVGSWGGPIAGGQSWP